MADLRKVREINIIPLGENGKFGNTAPEVKKAFDTFFAPAALHRMCIAVPDKDGKDEYLYLIFNQGEFHVEMPSP